MLMVAPRSYLDHNATAPLLNEAREAMTAALNCVGNPSSVHNEGRAARRIVERARREIAELCNGRSDGVVFTSGATEAATTLLCPKYQAGRGTVRMSRLYVSSADHPCLLSGGRFDREAVSVFPVDGNGVIDVNALAALLENHDKGEGLPLVATHLANNETGVIQPVEEIGKLARSHGAVFVVDAVQAVGRLPVDIAKIGADFLIVSSHKIGGPTGVGAFVADSDLLRPAPLVVGGGQERGHRAGTENLIGIAGFGPAAAAARTGVDNRRLIRDMRDRIERRIVEIAPDATIFGRDVARLDNTTFFAVANLEAETAQIAFDLAGVAVSAGSACSSGKVGPSHVLQAMGHGDQAGGLRVSLGVDTRPEDADRFLSAFEQLVERHASNSRAA